MKKEDYNDLFSNQKEIQDSISYNDIKEEVSKTIVTKEKARVNFVKYLIPVTIFLLFLTLTISYSITETINNKKQIEKEYNEAVEFFEENELNYEGLTQSEVIDVHNDIVTKSFSSEKTLQVIRDSIISKIVDNTIKIDDISYDLAENFWDYFKNLHTIRKEKEKGEAYYDFLTIFEIRDDHVIYRLCTVFNKYLDDEVIWSVEFEEHMTGYYIVNDGIIVVGHDIDYSKNSLYISKLSFDGEIEWKLVEEDFYNLHAFFENEDGYILFLNRGSHVAMYDLSKDGELSLIKEIILETSLTKVIKNKNGYIFFLVDSSYTGGVRTMCPFLQLRDEFGELLKEYTYQDEERLYKFKNAIEYDGKLFISGYSYIKEELFNYYDETNYIINRVWEKTNGGASISDEETTQIVKDNYKAVLFVYDEILDELVIFEEVEAALSHDLIVEDDYLVWQVEVIVQVRYSPATSSFTFGGVTQIYNCVLVGNDFEVIQTDEVGLFRK